MNYTEPKDTADLLNHLTDLHQADIILCNSAMDRGIERQIVNRCRSRKRRKNVVLLLVTSGGDADVAFRIARYLQYSYTKFTCFVPGWCKSAGTLISLGANEIVFGIHGELGPLDVQMAKKDELLDVESGLTVMTALTAIHEKTLLAFEHFFIETTVKGAGRISVQTASDIAVGLATGLFSPISEQIDPIHIGEAYRSMAIATEYGQRLIEKGKNAKPQALNKVISGYPSHGFVIDRMEAETVFEKVRESSLEEQEFIDSLGNTALAPTRKTLIMFLNEEMKEPENGNADNSTPHDDDGHPQETGRDAAPPESTQGGDRAN